MHQLHTVKQHYANLLGFGPQTGLLQKLDLLSNLKLCNGFHGPGE